MSRSAQLRTCGLDRFAVRRWVAAGRLHRRYPGVFTVGTSRADRSGGRLIAALFYAGEGAALSHATAAHWWRLIATAPDVIHISVPIRRRPVDGVVLHHPRRLERVLHHRLPVTPVPRTLLDFATDASHERGAQGPGAGGLSQTSLDLEEVRAVMGRGSPGKHQRSARLSTPTCPSSRRPRRPLEDEFLLLCEREGIALPLPNVWIGGYRVDALWPVERVIVELDGKAAHSSDARRLIDHERDLKLRDLRLRGASLRLAPGVRDTGRGGCRPQRTLAARRS